nr:unnamed protein product [Callosobruchus analis]
MDLINNESDEDFEEDLMQILGTYMILKRLKKKRITRRYWVHEINQKRSMCGEYHTLYPDLLQDNERFHMYFRVTKTQFEEIHEFIQSDIHKKDTTFRRAISTKERLAICLRFLATGSSFRSLGFNYRMGFSTVREIVQDVCDAIWKKMGPIHMPKPTTAMWEESENGFRNYWNFPNCCGALDGKHVIITCPINSGSNYWNYKGTNSIVLLALVDPKYRFLVIDVGSYGKNSDGGIFENSILGKLIQDGKLKFPGPKPLTLNSEPLPHVIVADEAFPLKPFLMRPYSKNDVCNNEPNKVFNYRLTRARRIVENAFGILRSRWRVFAGPMAVQPDMVDKIILATCCLHNYLGTDNLPSDCDDSLQANLTESTAFNHLNPIRRNSTQYAFSNVENSMDEQETEANEEDSLTGSASVTGNGGTYTDIQTGVDTGGTDSNEIVATTESASADKEGGIGNSTNRYQNHFKIPVGGVKKYKRKAVEMNETERRMEEAYEIMKQCRNAKPPKPTLCTAYGQLVATRLETLSEVNRIIMMNEIDNLFFRATMSHYQSAQYQSASPGPASPASANSFIHQPPQY